MKRRQSSRVTRITVAVAVSLGIHILYVVPYVIAPMLFKPESEIEVAYVPEDDTPSTDESKADETPPDEQPRDKKSEKKKDPEKLAKAPDPAQVKPPDPAQVKPTPPNPPKPIVQVPAQPAPPPPPPMVDKRKQMVSQDKFPDEKDNADARYLAEKNHRAEKETSAKETNLVREAEGARLISEPNENKLRDPGAKELKIAELENHQGPEKTMPRSSPMHGKEGLAQKNSSEPVGPLSMRDLKPKAVIDPAKGPTPREGLDKQEEGVGPLPMARVGQDQSRAQAQRKGGKANLQLDHHMYDNIEGFGTAEAERVKGARAERSHVAGRYDKYLSKLQAMRSSIENFTPDVKPGNQAELGTRASPFAGYITAMHRQIHKLWGFGFLQDIEGRSGPYSDLSLWTQLEIVLKGDGTVDKITIVRTSGVLGFDVAAIDAVQSAAPFPTPPSVIRSANGKVYLDWQFHRDENACGTWGVDPHILTTPGENQDHDTTEAGAGKSRLSRAAQAKEGLRSLSREATTQEEHAPAAHAEASSAATAPVVPANVPTVTAEVRSAAEGWFASYSRGDAAWMAGWSALPFTAAGEVVARDGAHLKTIYRAMLTENHASRKVSGIEVLTPAGMRGRLGGLPPGGSDTDMLFAVGKAGAEEFILLLKKSEDQGWRVAGIDR